MRVRDISRADELLKKCVDFFQKNGRLPTYSHILSRMGYNSPKTLSSDVKLLIERGDLEKDADNKIVLSEKIRSQFLSSPAISCGIKCGFPSEAVDGVDEYISLPAKIFGKTDENTVILRANGDSMTGTGIQDKDWLIVHKQDTANIGDAVIAMLEGGETTCKILKKDENGYYLQAANPDYPDIHPDREWNIYGVVRFVIHER